MVSSVGNFFSGNNTASAAMSFPLLPGVSTSTLKPNQTIAPNMTVAPTATDPGGPGVIKNGQATSYNNPALVYNQNQAAKQASAIRPSTHTGSSKPNWTPVTDAYGRESSKNSGVPYFDAKGKLVVPDTGFSGMSGQGGGGFSVVNPVGKTGAQGAGGVGGGGFGSAGQGTAGAAYNQPSSDEEKRSSTGDTQNISQRPFQTAYNAIGAQAQQTPVGSPEVPEVFDAAAIQSMLNNVSETINSTVNSAYSEADKQSIYTQLQQNLLAAKTKLDQATPLPPEPVVDTQEQMEFLNQNPDPFGVKQAMDQFRAEQTNLSELQTSRVEIMKSIQALNEAYAPIIKDIKQNPNMPKALARRKMEGLAVTQKETLQGFLDQLQIVGQQIDDQNQIVNRAFQIVGMSQDQDARMRDDMRQNLSLMINTGAIAGFNEADIQRYAQALGVNPAGLTKLKNEALTPKVDIVTNEFADGSLRAIDKNTGKTIWSLPGAAKVGGSSGGETYKSGGLTLPGSVVAEGEQRLRDSRGKDGYVDPTVYLNMYNTWTSKGGLTADFVKQYPPETYVNPANTWLPKELMPKSKKSVSNFL